MSTTRVFLEPIPINAPATISAGTTPMRTVLSSWKEIAAYFGKGVRTVQRWECELGLPVRRPRPNEKQIVLAFPEELDAWLRGHDRREPDEKNKYKQELVQLQKLMQKTMLETKRLQELTERMMRQSKEAQELYQNRKAS